MGGHLVRKETGVVHKLLLPESQMERTRTKYSVEGLLYAYKNEKSLWMHGLCSALAIILGIVFKITLVQWSMVLISLGVILSIELLNTAIEAVVDMLYA